MIPSRPTRANAVPPIIHGMSALFWLIIAGFLIATAAALAAEGAIIYAGMNLFLSMTAMFLARSSWLNFKRGAGQ